MRYVFCLALRQYRRTLRTRNLICHGYNSTGDVTMSIVINDLQIGLELDRQAMKDLQGGCYGPYHGHFETRCLVGDWYLRASPSLTYSPPVYLKTFKG